ECFVFQAEDGIRCLTVTGVQTCALPIYDRAAGGGGGGHADDVLLAAGGRAVADDRGAIDRVVDQHARAGGDGARRVLRRRVAVEIGRASCRESMEWCRGVASQGVIYAMR